MLKLYTDINFVNETYRRQLFPLLFDICILKNKSLNPFYEIVNVPEEADIFVMPIHYGTFCNFKVAFKSFENLAKQLNKKVWVYSAGDFGYTLKSGYYNFRLSGYTSKLGSSDIIIPSFINDPYLKLEQSFFTIPKTNQPEIGFVGHAKKGLKKWIKELLIHIKTQSRIIIKNEKSDLQPFYPSGYKRAKYLNEIQTLSKIQSNFIFRDQYRAGSNSEAEKAKTTLEFYNNMSLNAYTFCIRGAGNFSVRFYETLAMGRIPVLINTDCKLPLEHEIDWHKHAFIINENDIDSLEEKLLDFHSQFSNIAFIALQENNRKLWIEKLERVSFFKAIHNRFNV